MELNLTQIELRIIGSLIEKQLTTPEYYPLTLNALKIACNQKSNRNPVMDLTENELEDILYQMQLKKLVHKFSLAKSRTPRYKQLFKDAYALEDKEQVILTELFLRGPQTVGELRTHCNRMIGFADLDEVEQVLSGLMQKETPFVKKLERLPGHKESRYIHLFLSEEEQTPLIQEKPVHGKEDRIALLEERVDKLEHELSALKALIEQRED